MCGIFCYLGANHRLIDLLPYFNKIKHRGPDDTRIEKIRNDIIFGFHRLQINGLDKDSAQPMYYNGIWLIANAEIYNYKQLIEENNFEYESTGDCEIIIHMYKKYGIKETCLQLDGVFAFVLYDTVNNTVYAGRDRYGVRSMFYGVTSNLTDYFIASEMKAITFCNKIEQFPVGCYWSSSERNKYMKYYRFNCDFNYISDSDINIKRNINTLFTNAVKKRMMSDRKMCSLLSGGLDSTLTTAVLCKCVDDPKMINTYAIGLQGSEHTADLYYARMAAKYIGTTHYEVIVSEHEFLEAIEKTIIQIESYCTTTVRASVGNYLVSLYIENNRVEEDERLDMERDVVVFCGDFSDEIWGSYQGMRDAPNKFMFKEETKKLVRDCHYFDLLRSDKSISGAALEARVPFADYEFVEYIMRINPEMKMYSGDKLEKQLMRDAFKDDNILPYELLYRRKVAFSDGVSSQERCWFTIIQEYVNRIITDDEFELQQSTYIHNTPYDKESLYYRNIFEKYYSGHGNIIPYYWKHPFSTNQDPSARLLNNYKE
jgi:asparagine synthase (glutamine-hydrolysing)